MAQLVDGSVDAVFETYHRIVRPKLLLQLLSHHQFAGALKQPRQHFQRLTRQLEFDPALAQLTGMDVEFKGAKAD
jgi:hypothetical protein